MTLPRPYGGGYSSSAFPDTPIYDRLVAERGTPQIAPIRVPAAYDSMGYQHPAPQPSLPALPALPSGSSTPPPQHGGYQGGYQQAPARQPLAAPAPGGYPGHGGGHVPQQHGRPYPGPGVPQAPAPQQARPAAPQQMRPAPQPMRPAAPQQMRPAAPRPGGYPGNAPYPQQPQAQQAPAPGYWSEQGA